MHDLLTTSLRLPMPKASPEPVTWATSASHTTHPAPGQAVTPHSSLTQYKLSIAARDLTGEAYTVILVIFMDCSRAELFCY